LETVEFGHKDALMIMFLLDFARIALHVWEQNLFGSNETFGSIADASKVRIYIVGLLLAFPSETEVLHSSQAKRDDLYPRIEQVLFNP